MIRCATCGRETDELAGACDACETEPAASLAEHLLASPPEDDHAARPAEAPREPLVEALATEVRCPSCRTWVPPASRFCGVCGHALEAALPPAGP